jgi:sec1 family domain-containing protein 1
MYLNFLSSISRTLLETLASEVAASNTSHLVAQVYDQYLNFIVTEENLFSCGMSKVYHTLNDPTAAETVIEDTINRIVNSLFSVVITMGQLFLATLLLILRYDAHSTMSQRKCS